MSQLNVMSFDQRPHIVAVPMVNGYTLPGPPQFYGFPPQYSNFPTQFSHLSMQLPPHSNGLSQNGINGCGTAGGANGLEHVIESPLATPTGYSEDKLVESAMGRTPEATPDTNAIPSDGGSCCAPRKKHGHTSSVSSVVEPVEAPIANCCAGKAAPRGPERESIANGVSSHATPLPSPLILPHNVVPSGQPMYQQYPHITVFTYPPTYGSFQNPLQPQAWRQSIRANNYTQHPISLPPGVLPFNGPLFPESLDTVHTCSCGDTCQCIGCAAHPYNDATQDYVRSAWASISSSEISTNGQGQAPTNGTENKTIQQQQVEAGSSPPAHTPSSTTSGNGEEQSLSAADFFFVSYPFMSEGCEGDTQSCPCGDECQCLGCTIHRQSPAPCVGERESCECGDDCECIGCEFHTDA